MNQNKAKILQAASEIFLQGGTAALSVRAIAKQAGLSTIGIYSHFEGKQGILDALYIEGFERVIEAMDVLKDDIEPRAAVLLASENYLQLAQSSEAHYRLIFGESSGAYTPSPEAKLVAVNAYARLTDVVANALPEVSSKASKEAIALQLWALMHGNVSLKHHAVAELVDMEDWKARVLRAVEILIDGLAASSAGSSAE